MNETKKNENPGVNVSVKVDVEKVVKYLCITSVIITAIVAVCKVVPRLFNNISKNIVE